VFSEMLERGLASRHLPMDETTTGRVLDMRTSPPQKLAKPPSLTVACAA
jgi:hypothetical protein